ncbi:hypothetical protein KR009_012006 [Drosophila setifemur]|nr:hypothetical protein KR009_012006 [Drosophila setifemur]
MVKLIASLMLLAVVAQAYGDFKSEPESKSVVKELKIKADKQRQNPNQNQNQNHVEGQDQGCEGSLEVPEIPKAWIDMNQKCITKMRHQIQEEINASYQYLAMGAYFARDTVNRPGFAEHFFTAAKEEREHGSKLIEYLSMRGQLTDSVTNLITAPTVAKQEWRNGAVALEEALELETKVTRSIRDVIKTCESGKDNDYHLVDYLTGVYLEEQLHGQRELAGKLTTLKKMLTTHGELGEFLFDKSL